MPIIIEGILTYVQDYIDEYRYFPPNLKETSIIHGSDKIILTKLWINYATMQQVQKNLMGILLSSI